MAIKKKTSPTGKKSSQKKSTSAGVSKKKKSPAGELVSKKTSKKSTAHTGGSLLEKREERSAFERPVAHEPSSSHSHADHSSASGSENGESGLPVKAIILGAVLLFVFIFVAKDYIFPGKKESGSQPKIESTVPAPKTGTETGTDKPGAAKTEAVAAKPATAPAKTEPAVKPAATPAKPAETTGAPRQYTVKAGDNLMRIAASQLGDSKRYNEILEMNKDVLKSPSALKLGMVLKVPAK